MDIINLWIWKLESWAHLDDYLEECRELFPGKPIVLGCYLKDFFAGTPMPLEQLKIQWALIDKAVTSGAITGYSILAACLIDGQAEQARWVRDFIASH